jgi:hypothetical protein
MRSSVSTISDGAPNGLKTLKNIDLFDTHSIVGLIRSTVSI